MWETAQNTPLTNIFHDLILFALRYIRSLSKRCQISVVYTAICTVKGLPFDREGRCKFLECIITKPVQVNWTQCPHMPAPAFNILFEKLMGEQCNLSHCFFGIQFPFPPFMQELKLNDLNFYHNAHIFTGRPIDYGTKSMCLFEENNLKVIDLSAVTNIEMRQMEVILFITGLQQLHHFSFMQNKIASIDKRSFYDMPALGEILLSETNITDNQHLPSQLFSKNHGLKSIIFSSSSLVAVDKNAFLELPQLKILDLSNNLLTTSSFNVTISNTGLKILILRNNSLTGLNPYMCVQFGSTCPNTCGPKGQPSVLYM
jgi:hypothetical protein